MIGLKLIFAENTSQLTALPTLNKSTHWAVIVQYDLVKQTWPLKSHGGQRD